MIVKTTLVPEPLAGTDPEPVHPIGICRTPGWTMAAPTVAVTRVPGSMLFNPRPGLGDPAGEETYNAAPSCTLIESKSACDMPQLTSPTFPALTPLMVKDP